MRQKKQQITSRMQEHLYLVSYDFSSDKVRNKVAKLLEAYGRRVQYSVFACHLTDAKSKELYEKLLRLTQQETEGSILFFTICANCEKKRRIIGNIAGQSAFEEHEEEDIIVV